MVRPGFSQISEFLHFFYKMFLKLFGKSFGTNIFEKRLIFCRRKKYQRCLRKQLFVIYLFFKNVSFSAEETATQRRLRACDPFISSVYFLVSWFCKVFTSRHSNIIRSTTIERRWYQHRQKTNWATAEKLRREAWEKEKVKEIKEITIKGLEPEVHIPVFWAAGG